MIITLLINFTIAGKHEHHVGLSYKPSERNSVCCTSDYIFVAVSASYTPENGWRHAAVNVHSWTGLHLSTLSQQQLGVWKRSIDTIQSSRDGELLHLAIGTVVNVCSLHTYKVSCIFLVKYIVLLVL